MGYQWIKLHSDDTNLVDSIFRRMSERPYEVDSGWGFELIKRSGHEFVGNYIERKRRLREIPNPHGASQKIEWFDFQVFRFRIELETMLMEVSFSSAGIGPIINQLGLCSEWRVSVIPMIVSYSKLIRCLSEFKPKARTISVKTMSYPIDDSTDAVTFFKGRDLKLQNIKKIVGARDFKIKEYKIEVDSSDCCETVEVRSSGKVICSDIMKRYCINALVDQQN